MGRTDKKEIPSHIRQRAREVAQHEMGHHVMARLMGFTIGEVTVEVADRGAHSGGSIIHLAQSLTSIGDVRAYLERRVLVLYAGAMAETLPPGHVPEKGVNNERAAEIIHGSLGAEQDHAKAREALHLLRSILHPDTCDADDINEQLSALDLRLWSRARALVEEYEETIVNVACGLTQHLKEQRRGTYSAAYTKEVLDGLSGLKALPLLQP